jgi:hypothetical protein
VSIPARTVNSTFRALEQALARANAAIDKAEAASGVDFLSPEDEDYRAMAAGIGALIDQYWHLRQAAQS